MSFSNLSIKVVLSVIICLAVGFLSGFATSGAIDSWYETLNKPVFNPPNWIFGPVWTVLYIMMGVATALIWQVGYDKKEVRKAITIFGLHLLLNGFWSIAFFGMQQLVLALVVILVLLTMILLLIQRYYRIQPLAAYLLIPYALWVSFATLLNIAIVILN